MKKIVFLAVTGLMIASCAHEEGKVTIQLPADYSDNTIIVSHSTIDNMINAKQADDVIVLYDTLDIENGVAILTLDPSGASRYNIEPPMLTRMQPEFYASPGDNLKVTIRAFDPLDYEVSGTELMDDVTAFAAATDPIQQEYVRLAADENMTPEQSKEIWDRYDAAVKKFVKDHPKSPALPLAILNLGGDDFKAIYDNMSPEAKNSILMPFAQEYNKEVMKMVEERNAEEARKAEVASGTISAPDFTLPDLGGKNVSLADFRGKWVVLDFWGSWCGWCIKGFPALKDAYNK
ncbi:MAG: TlpA family protein disulfide reductase, partial [Muribaculaceae bacterium]|nr:TlpA family protein disulfide reductase [Muribaculaceae bacterium]